jgi:uncharacterized protein (TIGR02611 family)
VAQAAPGTHTYGREVRTTSERDRSASSRAVAGPTNRLTAFRDRVRRLPGGFLGWRIGVTVVGVAIIAGGIVLLPLPGPGWLIIFAGLGVLATEYEWAARLLRFARDKVKEWTRWLGRRPIWVRGVVGLVTLAIVVAAAWAVWTISR